MKAVKVQRINLPTEAENIRVNIKGNKGNIVEIIYDISEDALEANKPNKPEETKGSPEWLDKYFPIVRASTLSLEDEIFKHVPETDNQRKFKERLLKVMKGSKLEDFRAQVMDPSVDNNDLIYYKQGGKPEFRRPARWWEKEAKEFLPEKGSRLGFTEERILFLAMLIKELNNELGYSVSKSWKLVCDQSREIGHYIDSKGDFGDYEAAGSRRIGRWYDLANFCKITKNGKANSLSLVGGAYVYCGANLPLANVFRDWNPDRGHDDSVGWIVLSV